MRAILALCLLIALHAPSMAQAYVTMEMVTPKATGAAGTGHDASNRIYRAYTGIQYEIQATARGGHWPYTYSLSGAPSGMTIEAGPCTGIGPTCTAGKITWPSPTAGTTSPITVTITDKDGTQVTGTWSITVNTTIGADGFCFLDAVNGNNTTGNGSLAAPYKTMFKALSSCGARSFIYLKTGTYTIQAADGFTVGYESPQVIYGGWMTWGESTAGVIWVAYPGESPAIDFGSTGDSSNVLDEIQVRFVGKNVWLDGLEVKNVGSMAFNFNNLSGYGAVVRKCYFHDLLKAKSEQNSAYLMWTRWDTVPTYFNLIQNNTFGRVRGNGVPYVRPGDGHTFTDNGSMLKFYSTKKAIIEQSDFQDMPYDEAAIALKYETEDVTVRANTCTNNIYTCVGGNMGSYAGPPEVLTGGEIYHNLFIADTAAYHGTITIGLHSTSKIGSFSVYRNTLIGRLEFDNLGFYGDLTQTFDSNVILNAGGSGGSCPPRGYCGDINAVTNYSLIVINGNNVQGLNNGTIASGSTGRLVTGSASLGVAGFEMTSGSSSRGSGVLRLLGTMRLQ